MWRHSGQLIKWRGATHIEGMRSAACSRWCHQFPSSHLPSLCAPPLFRTPHSLLFRAASFTAPNAIQYQTRRFVHTQRWNSKPTHVSTNPSTMEDPFAPFASELLTQNPPPHSAEFRFTATTTTAHTSLNAIEPPLAAETMNEATPYPFTSQAAYEELLDELELRVEHRFHRPLLVQSLLFHCSLHRYLSFLGAGILRFYASYALYEKFPHYEEGYLTRVKDSFHTGTNLQELMQSDELGVDLSGAIRIIEAAKSQWNREKGPTNHPFEQLDSKQVRKMSKKKRAAANLPHTAFSSDILPALLGALYFDGGWTALDRFANKAIVPKLLQLQSMLEPELPDEDLGTQNYKKHLQPLVQRLYGVTPLYEVVRCDSELRWSIRVVIPVLQQKQKVRVTESTLHPRSAFPQTQIIVHPEPIVFDTFCGTKRMAEQRAARSAYFTILKQREAGENSESIEQLLRKDTTDESDAAKQLKPRFVALSSRVQSTAAAEFTDAEWETIRTELHELVESMCSASAKSVMMNQTTGEASSGSHSNLTEDINELDALPAIQDPFELALAELSPSFQSPQPSTPSSATASTPTSSTVVDSQWTNADFDALIETLHAAKSWKSFPILWSLMQEVGYTISPSVARILIDSLAEAKALPMVIQAFRRIRHQQKWQVSSHLMHHILLAATRANKLWGWQQVEKLLIELANDAREAARLNPEQSHDKMPSIQHYNAALWGCVCGFHSLAESMAREVSSPAIVSPISILKVADRLRAMLRADQLQLEPSTIGMLAILDAYANRSHRSWNLINQLEEIVGYVPSKSSDRLSSEQKHASRTEPGAELVLAAHRAEFERKQFPTYAKDAKIVTQAVDLALKHHFKVDDCELTGDLMEDTAEDEEEQKEE